MSNSYPDLIALINGSFSLRNFRLIAELLPRIAFQRAAKQFVARHASTVIARKNNDNTVSITLHPCEARVDSVRRMREWLNRHVKNDIFPPVLHGSLGTNEVVPYTDFDALIIIKNEVLKDCQRLAGAAFRLFQAKQFMYQQDPLQHHGWFVLPEYALSAWPESYLPVEVLKNATVLTESEPVKLSLTPVFDSEQSRAALYGLLQGIIRELNTGLCFKNLYQFKSTVSKILLMPAFYVQARDDRGVFKRDSFNMAKADFSAIEWQPIEAASRIRQQWPLLDRRRPHFFWESPGLLGKVWRKNFSPPVPMTLREQFDEKIVDALKTLIHLMEQSALSTQKELTRK